MDRLTHGRAEHLTGLPWGAYVLPPNDMMIVNTTIHGIQLFLQGHGYGGIWAAAIAEPDRTFEAAGDIDAGLAEVPGTWLEELPRK